MTDLEQVAASHGFTAVKSEPISEVEGTVHLMHHTASGARLMFIENDDANKAFSITFKTPAADDTGVFHILEHSVLCGSEKFPVKEPFVNLLKTSMQTFLNAMTFPDKTMYPVASTNEQDLVNLMDVYLDAVFHPDIYRRPVIFQQEGWHRELEGEGEDARLVVNGVVYNEMKGALSEPDSVLYDGLSAALFPDTTYRFESGGTPAAIPTLTYEGFLENHQRHYRPDNAYIILYGNLDADRVLGFLDERYLAPLAAKECGPLDINPLGLQAPVAPAPVVVPMATAPENACAAVGFVIGRAAERERIVAADILMDAIMGANESPLKRALLDAGIADDAIGYVADSVAQPFAVVSLRAPGSAAERLRAIVAAEARRLAEGGPTDWCGRPSPRRVRHARAQLRLPRRRGAGHPPWPDNFFRRRPGGFCASDVFASLREKVEEGYFEALLRELFLDNDHRACAEVVPTESDEAAEEAEAAGAREAAAELTEDGPRLSARPCARCAGRRRRTRRRPSAAALRADIGEAPAEAMWEVGECGPWCLIRHHLPCRGIAYAYRYFAMDGLAFDELPYATVLACVLGKLDTARHTAAELDTLVQAHLGNLGFAVEVHEDAEDRERIRPMFVMGSSALDEEVPWAARLAEEVLRETDFSDIERIRDILGQRRIAMEQARLGRPQRRHGAGRLLLPAGRVVREALSGVGFRFLKELLASFDERPASLEAGRAVPPPVHRRRLHVSFGGDEAALAAFREASSPFGGMAAPRRSRCRRPRMGTGLVVASDVTYTAYTAACSASPMAVRGFWPRASCPTIFCGRRCA
ncbi:MAG: insulinase family protein [Coriobacteriaceae bacterium]